jgi:hypothetical protein
MQQAPLLTLFAKPYWVKNDHLYFGNFYPGDTNGEVSVFMTGAEKTCELIVQHLKPGAGDVMITCNNSLEAAAKQLKALIEKAGKACSITVVEDAGPGLNRKPGLMANTALAVVFYEDPDTQKMIRAGVSTLFELAVVPPALLARLTGLGAETCIYRSAQAMFLLVRGIDKDLAHVLIKKAGYSCLEDLVKAEPKELYVQLKGLMLNPPTADGIKELQLAAKETALHIATKTLSAYSPEQLILIIEENGPEPLAARLSILAKLFNDPVLEAYQRVLNELGGVEVLLDRNKLKTLLADIKNQLGKLTAMHTAVFSRLKAEIPGWASSNGINTLTGISAEHVAALAAQGVRSLSDLRLIDVNELATRLALPPEQLVRWKQMADLVSIPVISKELAYAITDLGEYKAALHVYQYQYSGMNFLKWGFGYTEEQRKLFKDDASSRLKVRIKELVKTGILKDPVFSNTIFGSDQYFLELENIMSAYNYLRIGIVHEDSEFKNKLASLMNAGSRDLICRLVPVPLSDNSIAEAQALCCPLVLKLKNGPASVSLPLKSDDVYQEDYFAASNKLGKAIASALGCGVLQTKPEDYRADFKNKIRSLEVTLPPDADNDLLNAIIENLDEALWQVTNHHVGYVCGKVVSPSGHPVAGVRVTLTPQRQNINSTHVIFSGERRYPEVYTNRAGRYVFKVAHRPRMWGIDGRGAILQASYPGAVISNSYLPFLFYDGKFGYEFSHVLNPVTES